MRIPGWLPVVACLAMTGVLAPAARAGDEPVAAEPAHKSTRPNPDAVAQAVIAALPSKDEEKIAAAFEGGGIDDLWIVTDAILLRGDAASAEAFSTFLAGASKEYSGLPAYVATRRGAKEDPSARRTLEAAEDALERNDASAALKAIDALAKRADGVTLVRLRDARGDALAILGQRQEAAIEWVGAAEAAEALGWHMKAHSLYLLGGQTALDVADLALALKAWQRRQAVAATVDLAGDATLALAEIGRLLVRLGRYKEALEVAHKALAAYEADGNRAAALRVSECIGTIHLGLGDDATACECLYRALKRADELNLQPEAAFTLMTLGNAHLSSGRFDDALQCYTRALEIRRKLALEDDVATTLSSLGNLHAARGENSKAIEAMEQALAIKEKTEDRANTAVILGNIGLVKARLNEPERALHFHERSLELKRAVGDRAGTAVTLDNIGNTHYLLGDFDKALEFHEQALAIEVDLSDRAGQAWTLGNIGLVHAARGRQALDEGLEEEGRASLTKAVDFHARALKLSETLADRVGIGRSLEKVGRAWAALGDAAKAREALDRAITAAEALQNDRMLFDALEASAKQRFQSEDARAACERAHRACALIPSLMRGLGDAEGAGARGARAALFGIGTLAAARIADAAEVAFFVESGRAGSLVEALGGRDALRSAVLPPALAAEETRARAELAQAQDAYTQVVAKGDRLAMKRPAEALDFAQKRLADVIAKIQRTAKREASVLYSEPDALGVIASRLAKDEALVEYALCDPDAVALVVTSAGGRIVPLGKTADVVAACEAFRFDDPKEDVGPGVEALARALVEPLGLSPDVRRVFFSPEAALAYVPFSALRTSGEIVCVPSATTYGVLREEKATKGEGFLALGDPYYGDPNEPSGGDAPTRAGPRLAALPGTRVEATAIGDVVLLGKDANELRFRQALPDRSRWRAIHFACHGLPNADQPLLSSLALTPAGAEDGFLTAHEIVRMKIPADLVVLSACETSKGQVIQGEGTLGLTRAFMLAGAPRVVCSLWKVDDEATRELMKKFYALWKAGSPTAKALAEAQAYIRAQPQWKHPSYWAAWVLWGLPD